MSLERFFAQEILFEKAMKPFTWQHAAFILLALATIYLTLKYAQAIKNSPNEKKYKIAFASWVLLLELLYHIHYWMHGMFSVPFHMCSVGAFLSVYVLLTDSKLAFQMLFLIGLTGGTIALLIPDTIGYPYYNIRYYLFPLMHMNIMIVPMYYYKAYGYRVLQRSIYITFFFIMALLPFANILNNMYDRNYLFIGAKPRIFGELLPDYPWYMILGAIGLFIVFHFLYYLQFRSTEQLKEFTKTKILRRSNNNGA